MAVRLVKKVCFDIVRVRMSHVCRGFHGTRKQQHSRTVKRRTIFPQTNNRINAANVPPQQPPLPPNKLEDIRGIIESLTDDSQFE